MADQLEIGLIGAGPWAGLFHAPMIAGGPGTRLAAVWARRPEAARALASEHATQAVSTVAELFDRCQAVAFAVPPDVQAELAAQAARAGKHVLLEKPIGIELGEAQRLADAVGEAGVISQLVLTNRYRRRVRSFIDAVSGTRAFGGFTDYIADGALPGSTFATPWRIERGALLDLGPHALDLLDACVGPIEAVRAVGDPRRWVALTVEHADGVLSQAALSITTPKATRGFNLVVHTADGPMSLSNIDSDAEESLLDVASTIVTEFAEAIAQGRPHPLDVQRGLYLQRFIDAAAHATG
jgi:predicted dehydrogenase